MMKTHEYKLYPSSGQRKALERWLAVCCWMYNLALEQRIKSHQRRGESVAIYDQFVLLTKLRSRIESLRAVPVAFERDALRRVDRGMKAFFRRLKEGGKPGFPRFRSWRRYNSLECLAEGVYLRGGRMRIPNMGLVKCRGRAMPEGRQKALRIIRRASGWFAQIVVDDGKSAPETLPVATSIGVDVGLASFATTSDGVKIENPRLGAKSQRKLRSLQRRVSRRSSKESKRRRSAAHRVRRQHEKIAAQRRNFCHEHSTALVRKYDLIAVEKLNVKGMSRSRLAKSILDAAWSTFTTQLVVKAAYAGRQVVFVNACGTSQECPECGAIKPKELSERIHSCACGLTCDRDHASARVILARAVAGKRGDSRVEGGGSDRQFCAVGETAPSETRRPAWCSTK